MSNGHSTQITSTGSLQNCYADKTQHGFFRQMCNVLLSDVFDSMFYRFPLLHQLQAWNCFFYWNGDLNDLGWYIKSLVLV